LAAMIVDPDNVWTTTPQNCMKYFEFMSKVGSVKHPPENWKNLFMPICHELPGS
jgi:NitT/TauT family transport system substrate-binding protein